MYIRTLVYKKRNHETLAALQYKPLYDISRSEKWIKNTSCGFTLAKTENNNTPKKLGRSSSNEFHIK
jgi:hypothetical protein